MISDSKAAIRGEKVSGRESNGCCGQRAKREQVKGRKEDIDNA
jgi:hypothetical protein